MLNYEKHCLLWQNFMLALPYSLGEKSSAIMLSKGDIVTEQANDVTVTKNFHDASLPIRVLGSSSKKQNKYDYE